MAEEVEGLVMAASCEVSEAVPSIDASEPELAAEEAVVGRPIVGD